MGEMKTPDTDKEEFSVWDTNQKTPQHIWIHKDPHYVYKCS